jgi:two-component system, NarL family, sensor histidine kinase EvgS
MWCQISRARSGSFKALVCALGVATGLLAVTATAAATDYRFATTTGVPTTAFSVDALSAEERAFIAALPEIRVGLPTPPTEPYESIGPDGEVTGIHAQMLVALARTFGLRLKPVVLPSWSLTLQAAKERKIDMILTLSVTAERMEYLAFTLGATPLPGALTARLGARVDPERAIYALERDYMVNDWVRRQYPQASILSVDSTLQALQAVQDGKADVHLGGLLEVNAARARGPVAGLEINRLMSFGTGYYHYGVRKDWAPLAAILNKGIQSLRTANTDQLAATLGGLPGAATLRRPLPLSTDEALVLAGKPVWRVGAVRGLSLLNEVDERGMHSGIAAEYTEQVAQRLGVGVTVVVFESVAAMLDGLRQGQIDVVPLATRTAKRMPDFAFSDAYLDMPHVLLARSDEAYYWGLDSLRGKTLALRLQHPLRDVLAASYPDIRIIDAATAEDAVELVLRREAEATVEIKLFANQRISQQGGERLRVVAELPEVPSSLHFATRQASAPLLGLINRALADIAATERQRMLRRWVAVDLTPAFPWRRHAPLMAAVMALLLILAGGTAWWIRRLKREAEARRRSEQLLNDIATTMPGVAFRYVLNADNSLRHHFFSPSAKALLGLELNPKELILKTMAPRLLPDELRSAAALQAECMATGEPFSVRMTYAHPDGRQQRLHVEALRTFSAQKRPIWTGYIVDMSTEYELQRRLAQEAHSRNVMLASASHELRAPTHTLSLALQSLPMEGLSEPQRTAVQIAQSSAHTLSELLSDVLDAARDGHEALRLKPCNFDLHTLLEDLAGAWRSAARSKGLAFLLDIASDVPRVIQTDPLRLKQVLINLLSNACKYTALGQVSLRAKRSETGALLLEVADTGIGIEPAAQAQLFKPYVTLVDPQGRPPVEGSTGLGLATSQRLAAMLGGTLVLSSQPAIGTRVTLCLPLPQNTQAAAVPQGQILVCDDDDISRMLMTLMLRRQGLDIVEAADSAQALAMWRRGGVRALVSDLDMPGMGGLELIRTLRIEEAGSPLRTAVIVCSGSPVSTEDNAAAVPPYDAYLVKPVNLRTLTATLRQLGVVSA